MGNKMSDEQKDKQLEQVISQRSLSGFLSDSKWVKLIKMLVENADVVKRINFRLVVNGVKGELLVTEDTAYEFDYWGIGFEGMTSLGGWLLYKEIERLDFPRVFYESGKERTQDIDAVKEHITRLGIFELDESREMLTLFRYR